MSPAFATRPYLTVGRGVGKMSWVCCYGGGVACLGTSVRHSRRDLVFCGGRCNIIGGRVFVGSHGSLGRKAIGQWGNTAVRREGNDPGARPWGLAEAMGFVQTPDVGMGQGPGCRVPGIWHPVLDTWYLGKGALFQQTGKRLYALSEASPVSGSGGGCRPDPTSEGGEVPERPKGVDCKSTAGRLRRFESFPPHQGRE